MAKMKRVTRSEHCPVCGKADWCRVSGDKRYAVCNRISSKQDAKGDGGGWIHWLADAARLPSLKVSVTVNEESPVADITTRHATYSRLLQLCPLSRGHIANLERRGIAEAERRQRGYGTLSSDARPSLCDALQPEYQLQGVPGFCIQNDMWTIAGWPGLLLPVRDYEKRIQAMQVRRDGNCASRYAWLSSAGRPAGCSSGAPVHHAYPANAITDAQVWLTEGPLKADIACEHLGCVVLAIPGIASWRAGLEVAKRFKRRADMLVIALDSDARTNPAVKHVRDALIIEALEQGWVPRVALWPPEFKGLDDMLVAKTDWSVINPFRDQLNELGLKTYDAEVDDGEVIR